MNGKQGVLNRGGKLIYISSSVIPSRMANSVHVMKMCAAFSRLGVHVTLVAKNDGASMESGVEDVYEHYGVPRAFSVRSLPWVRWLKGRGYLYGFLAAVYARACCPNLIYSRNLFGAYVATLLKLPLVLELHAPISPESFEGRLFKGVLKRKAFKRVVVISQYLVEHLSADYDLTEGRVSLLHDASDVVPNSLKQEASSAFGARFNVGYVGHLYAGRGVEIIVSLASRFPQVTFHIIGGMESDISNLKAKTASMNNLIIHGFVSPNAAVALRQRCDVLLAPYQQKVAVAGGGDTSKWMSPLKLFEYMATGNPIIASNLPALREVLEHRRNCLLCEPDEIEGWSDALALLLEHERLRSSLGEAARQEFESKYTWDARAKAVIEQVAV